MYTYIYIYMSNALVSCLVIALKAFLVAPWAPARHPAENGSASGAPGWFFPAWVSFEPVELHYYWVNAFLLVEYLDP